ncbi:MAG: dTMP kinase [Christensenellales bacterium]
MKGKIIVIEGTDGSGKKTQTELLYNHLLEEGKKVVKHSFPSYNLPCSGGIKMYLGGELGNTADCVSSKQASILFASDRVATYLDENLGLKKHYEEGGIIIFDRYVQSNMIHQACKIQNKKEIKRYLKWTDKLEFDDLSLPRADLVLFLDMPPQVSKQLADSREKLKAGTKQDIHEMDYNYLLRAYDTAKYVSKKFNWKTVSCLNNATIKSREEISNEVFKIVSDFLNKKTD